MAVYHILSDGSKTDSVRGHKINIKNFLDTAKKQKDGDTKSNAGGDIKGDSR